MTNDAVTIRFEDVVFPTYMPALPDRNPMFLEKRVYQGSSGKVYPLPFVDRIASEPIDRKWRAVWIENEFLRVMVLPEIGGRVHVVEDKTNGYDAIYRQNVIKPALVGLAGPWISGGIEFNWPQHHRPATFLPVDTFVENAEDGSITLWCSDHDPMARMKGMHGVCLRPGSALLELRVRAYNRTPMVQTFLWWANVATRVHEAYQSFFPPDVSYVADHARRSTSEYPLCKGLYYGVDYAGRAAQGIPDHEYPPQFLPPACGGKPTVDYPANDLSFYANIPVPTSYMCMGSQQDFFGGYDHAAQAGIIHIANHHISPGKKQWTWGNHDFGYAWDRNLTDPGAASGAMPEEYSPYIEIMAGVYTDNQPDFSFLHPGETKTWTQYWYPIQKIGPAHHANLDAAVSLHISADRIRVGVSVSREIPNATVELKQIGRVAVWSTDLAPGKSLLVNQAQPSEKFTDEPMILRVLDEAKKAVIEYRRSVPETKQVPAPATEPDAPAVIPSNDELFLTGLHLDQYRHATRSPTEYWLEALRRDPLDSRCNNAMGLWRLRRGELRSAERHFRAAIERQTRRNANPYDGEPLYNLALTLRYQVDSEIEPPGSNDSRFEQAYASFYKATWNAAWASAGFHALAEMDCRVAKWTTALEHLDLCLRFDTDNLRARDLKTIVLRRLNRTKEADSLLAATLAMDPLDQWARYLSGEPVSCELQTILDLSHDYARAGLYADAIALLSKRIDESGAAGAQLDLPDQGWGGMPMALYTLGWLQARAGDIPAAIHSCRCGSELPSDYCFPARLEEIAVLQHAIAMNPGDPRAPYYLGNLLYDRRRHDEAIDMWERSVGIDANFSIPWRNLGIGYYNIRHDLSKAKDAYEKAVNAAPADGRLVFEQDQLWKRGDVHPEKRLEELVNRRALVDQRDDLTIELCALLNQTGQHERALELLTRRKFQPWEGGEGQALGQWVRTHLALGRNILHKGEPAAAVEHFLAALSPPLNLCECKHLLVNQSDIHFWLGEAYAAANLPEEAQRFWMAAAEFKGNFQEMSVRTYSEMTYFSALAMLRLHRKGDGEDLLKSLLKYAVNLFGANVQIDYFATSLPTMLLFESDLLRQQETTALFIQAQASLGLGEPQTARTLLQQVLQRDPNHALAADLWAEAQAPSNSEAAASRTKRSRQETAAASLKGQ